MMKKFCQSCGMPMDKDPKGGGSEAGGGVSGKYCSYCYVDGRFTKPDFTAGQMQDFCRQKMVEMGMSKFTAWLFTRCIPKLERWKGK